MSDLAEQAAIANREDVAAVAARRAFLLTLAGRFVEQAANGDDIHTVMVLHGIGAEMGEDIGVSDLADAAAEVRRAADFESGIADAAVESARHIRERGLPR